MYVPPLFESIWKYIYISVRIYWRIYALHALTYLNILISIYTFLGMPLHVLYTLTYMKVFPEHIYFNIAYWNEINAYDKENTFHNYI